jgi:hypothetical protein
MAGFLLETGEPDTEFDEERLCVVGTDLCVGGSRRCQTRTMPLASFSYGTQVCEVEVDPRLVPSSGDQQAIVDALADLGVRHIEMSATPSVSDARSATLALNLPANKGISGGSEDESNLILLICTGYFL